MIELLEDERQDKAADWFSESMTKKEGHWMLAHAGPGFSNTNGSLEAHWRMLKGAVLGTAGSSGAGYSHLRMQSNLIGYIENESIQTLEAMMQKKQAVAFPSSAKYSKGVYDRLQDFPGGYLVDCDAIGEDAAFKDLKRVIAAAEGVSLYSKLINLRKGQRVSETILKGERRIVMLSKWGGENMKIDLETGRRARSVEMEERLKIYLQLMDEEVKPEEVKCDVKLFFKAYSSFHLVTVADGVKARCSCPGYYQEMVCKHAALMDMCYDVLFQIQAKFEEECAEFRRRVGRRKGMQKEEEEPKKKKKKGWDVMICGGDDDSDEYVSLSSKRYEQFPEDRGTVSTGMGGGGEGAAMDQNTELRVGSFEGTGGLDLGAGMDTRTIPSPSWKKIGGVESDASSASTYVGDGKMGRSRVVPSVPRGIYAMGAPRTNMSPYVNKTHWLTRWDCDSEVESSGLEEMGEVS